MCVRLFNSCRLIASMLAVVAGMLMAVCNVQALTYNSDVVITNVINANSDVVNFGTAANNITMTINTNNPSPNIPCGFANVSAVNIGAAGYTNNRILMSGTGSVFTNGGTTFAGSNNILSVSNGALYGNTGANISALGTRNGILVSGANSYFGTRNAPISGVGSFLIVENGAYADCTGNNGYSFAATAGDKHNYITVSGAGAYLSVSTWSGDNFGIGGSSNSYLIAQGGYVRMSSIGMSSGSYMSNNITITGAGSAMTNNNCANSTANFTFGGSGGPHKMLVSNGGRYSSAGSFASYFGGAGSRNNIIEVTGSGSTWNQNALAFLIGYDVAATGNVLNVYDGASFTNAGAVTIGGINNAFIIGDGNAVSTAQVSSVNLSHSSAQLRFNNGVLRARSSGNFIYGSGSVSNAGPCIIDTVAFTCTNASRIYGDGMFIKTGSGTLSFSSLGSIACANIIVTNGTLSLDSPTCVVPMTNSELRLYAGATNRLNYSGFIYRSRIYTNDVLLASGVYNSGNLPAFLTSSGSLSSADVNFTNLPPSRTSTSLVVNGSISCLGTSFDVYAYWNTVDGGTNYTTWTNSVLVGSFTNTATNFSYAITGVDNSMTYYATLQASNVVSDIWATPSVSVAPYASYVYTWYRAEDGSWSTGFTNSFGTVEPPVASTNTVLVFRNAGSYIANNNLTNNPFMLNQIICTNATTVIITGSNVSFQGVSAGVWNLGGGTLSISNINVSLDTNVIFHGTIRHYNIAGKIWSGPGSLSITNGTTTFQSSGGTNTFPGGINVTNSGSLFWGAANQVSVGNITVSKGCVLSEYFNTYLPSIITMNGGSLNPTSQDGAWAGLMVLAAGTTNTIHNGAYGFSGSGKLTGGGIPSFYTGYGASITNRSSDFSGPVYIRQSTLNVPQLNSVAGGLATSAMGHPTNAASGTIYIGMGASTACGLNYYGTNETTDRILNFPSTTYAISVSHSGPTNTLLKFTSDFAVPGVAANDCRKTLTLTVTSNATMEIAGCIPDATLGAAGQTNTTILKNGIGTVLLSGTNTYMGYTTITQGTFAVSGYLNCTNIVVTNGVLALASQTCLTTNAVVRVYSSGTNNITYSRTIYIKDIYTNDVPLAKGIYNAGVMPAFFKGPGSLSTLTPPGAGTVIIMR